jgi:hypothetical protein
VPGVQLARVTIFEAEVVVMVSALFVVGQALALQFVAPVTDEIVAAWATVVLKEKTKKPATNISAENLRNVRKKFFTKFIL